MIFFDSIFLYYSMIFYVQYNYSASIKFYIHIVFFTSSLDFYRSYFVREAFYIYVILREKKRKVLDRFD